MELILEKISNQEKNWIKKIFCLMALYKE